MRLICHKTLPALKKGTKSESDINIECFVVNVKGKEGTCFGHYSILRIPVASPCQHLRALRFLIVI